MTPRYYQEEAIAAVYSYFEENTGNPLVSVSTGGGKSLIIAEFIRRACSSWKSTRAVVLAHRKELLKQNCKTLLRVWPEAPVAYYSAGIGQKAVNQITFAGIQSCYDSPGLFSPIDLVFIDEAHLLSPDEGTMYQQFIGGLKRYNPKLKIIGLTATPYRLKEGLLTEGDGALFDEVVYETDIGRLVKEGFLCPLISRAGVAKANLDAVHVRGGEYVMREVSEASCGDGVIDAAVDEIIALAGERKAWLLFCADVAHTEAVAVALKARGISTVAVHGKLKKHARDQAMAGFIGGHYRAAVNCEVMTTGLDYPGIDLIVLLRPTKSTSLYVQMVGRGFRIAPTKTDTLVLDYAGNVERFGPVDQIKMRPKGPKGEGGVTVAPAKECEQCHAFCPTGCARCPECGWAFPPPDTQAHGDRASDAPVLAATHVETLPVDRVGYHIHQKVGRSDSLRVDHWCGVRIFTEYVCPEHGGFATKRAMQWCWDRGVTMPKTTAELFEIAMQGRIRVPSQIVVRPDGKYWRIEKAEGFKDGVATKELIDDEVPF